MLTLVDWRYRVAASLLSALLALIGPAGAASGGSVADGAGPAHDSIVTTAVDHWTLVGVVRSHAQPQSASIRHLAPLTPVLSTADIDRHRPLDAATFEPHSDGSCTAVGRSVRFRGPPSRRQIFPLHSM